MKTPHTASLHLPIYSPNTHQRLPGWEEQVENACGWGTAGPMPSSQGYHQRQCQALAHQSSHTWP